MTGNDEVYSVEKLWWQSRTVWGGFAAVVAGVGGALFGAEWDQEQMLELIMMGVSVAGGVMAIHGRLKATQPIKQLKRES